MPISQTHRLKISILGVFDEVKIVSEVEFGRKKSQEIHAVSEAAETVV